jgi:hypothetical protein
MFIQAVQFLALMCLLASSMPAVPAADSELFANYHSGDKPALMRGGWRVGGTARKGEYVGVRSIGFLLTPSASGRLERIEIAVKRESGSGDLIGYLMADAQGPGNVIAQVSFSVPDSSEAVIVSANVASPPVISDSKRYWFVLEATDPVKDSIFWARWERQPATTMAIRESKSWHIEEGAFGAMLRMYGR